MTKTRVALIGCGRVARVHAAALTSLDETELVAVVDIKPDRAEAFSERYGAKAYTDYKDVLNLPEVDAVQLATPHHTHAQITIDALKAGKHVLTEKPMAITVPDMEAMIKTAEESNRTLGVIFQNRYNDASQAVKQAIDSGQLGAIKGTRAVITWRRTDEYYTQSDWKGTWDKEGGGVLIDQAIHTIDLMQWLVGEVDWLEARYDTRAHDIIDVDDVAEAHIVFENGAIGCLYASCNYSYDAPVFLEVHGEKGIAHIIGDTATITIGSKTVTVEQEPDEANGLRYWGFSHKRQIKDFYRAVQAGKQPFIDGRAGKVAVDMVLAMYESSRRQTPIYFPYVPGAPSCSKSRGGCCSCE
ncbi:MAG: Gfo/Idh/MocA family oxidoreductase [Firmicutes bacterium]|nr:Gfo/Idh/MocA family oxidoreductase [Bacillota bacterium]